jgi:hypothetical protein
MDASVDFEEGEEEAPKRHEEARVPSDLVEASTVSI